jgi:protein O-GlcNAc transferase
MSSLSAQFDRAMLLHQQGDLAAAAQMYRNILAADANHPAATHLLGLIAHQTGQSAEAEPLMRRSLLLAEQTPNFHNNYALVCAALERVEDAETHLRRAVELEPAYLDAWLNFAKVLESRGALAAAHDALERAACLDPRSVDILNHLGRLRVQLGRREEAAAAWRASMALTPTFDAASDLAAVLAELGQLDDAIAAGEAALRIDSRRPRGHVSLANALAQRGRKGEGIAAYRRAIELDPSYFEAWANLAVALESVNRIDEAVVAVEKALALQSDNAVAMTTLGLLRRRQNRLDDAIDLWRRAAEVSPDYFAATNNLAGALMERGEVSEAIRMCRRTLTQQPAHAGAHSNLLLALHYDPAQSPQSIADEHQAYGRAYRFESVSFPRQRHSAQRIRIGYVSPNFRQHAVATFIEGILRSHDRSKFQITCYSDARPHEMDETTASMRANVDRWFDTAHLNDEELVAHIRSSGEDILVDLSGHIARNRMRTFARRAAPVQVTYLGYQNTTGLDAMDYRLTDAVADPPGGTEAFHVERLERLRCFFVYSPPAIAPDVAPLPAMRNRYITFGSLNNPPKHNEAIIATWAKVMQRVSGSKIVLLINAPGESERQFVELFATHGIAADRVRLIVRDTQASYLRAYENIDIAFDPSPFSGHTTTCDALWMGVPVITLAGAIYAGRMTTSVLTHLPMPQWIAANEREYVDKAAELAADVPRLAKLRSSLRPMMQQSPITDAAAFTADLENAYRRMWARWCERV